LAQNCALIYCFVLYLLTYVKLTEMQTSRTNFTTEQKVEFIIKVIEQQLSITFVVIIIMFTCNIPF